MKRCFTKEERGRWPKSIWEGVQHHLSLGACTLKPQGDITTCLLGKLKQKIAIILNAGKDAPKLDHLHIAAKRGTLGNSLAIVYKTKHVIAVLTQQHSWALAPEK